MNYILIQWPDSQMIMEEPWFNECLLANPNSQETEWIGSSAYFVPIEYYKKYSEKYDPKWIDNI